MRFVEYLKNTYGCNEPIYINEVEFSGYSKPWIKNEFKKLVSSGEIRRFALGIYYIPVRTRLGESTINPYKIMQRRFMSDGNEIYGYLTGLSLLNWAGISTQVPNSIEITTNRESSNVRTVRVGAQRVRARRSRTTITKDNVKTLRFLELMNTINLSSLDETDWFMLRKFTAESDVRRSDVSQYVKFFPKRVNTALIESGVIYDLA